MTDDYKAMLATILADMGDCRVVSKTDKIAAMLADVDPFVILENSSGERMTLHACVDDLDVGDRIIVGNGKAEIEKANK